MSKKVAPVEDAGGSGFEVGGVGDVDEDRHMGEKEKKRKTSLDRRIGKFGDKNQKRVKEKKEADLDAIKDAGEMLETLTNPFDTMDWDTKKHLGVYFYFTYLKDNVVGLSASAFDYAASMVQVSSRTVRSWVLDYKVTKELGYYLYPK